MIINKFPRRYRLDLNTPAELAIDNAIKAAEKIGASTKLTNAVVLLSKAKELIGDFVDDKMQSTFHNEDDKEMPLSVDGFEKLEANIKLFPEIFNP